MTERITQETIAELMADPQDKGSDAWCRESINFLAALEDDEAVYVAGFTAAVNVFRSLLAAAEGATYEQGVRDAAAAAKDVYDHLCRHDSGDYHAGALNGITCVASAILALLPPAPSDAASEKEK